MVPNDPFSLFRFGQPLLVWDDHGPVGKGASEARHVTAENGQDYIAKGPAICPTAPRVAPNELISVQLASILGLPVLDSCLLRWGEDLAFGSAWMNDGTWTDAISEEILSQCVNAFRLSGMVAFDVWVANLDRSHRNIVTRTQGRRVAGKPPSRTLILNDHSHSILAPHLDVTDIPQIDAYPLERFVPLELVRTSLTSASDLSRAIAAVEGVDESLIHAAIEAVPGQWLDAPRKGILEQWLVRRRGQVRNIISRGCHLFPNLGGAI